MCIRDRNGRDAWLANVKWEEYNYPPLLNVVHFKLSELENPHRNMVQKIHFCFVLIFLISIINFINSIVQTISGYSALLIIYSILNFIIFNIFAFYVFYKGYRGVCAESSSVRIYRILQVIVSLLWIALATVDTHGINGFMRMKRMLDDGYVLSGVLSLIESALYIVSSLLGIYCVVKISPFE
eukprot:TRINITY_DN9597_c0_g1_i4.p1 TRINITY_DN9597_c0_g1~~TRINITY_DN9597_c0_g1_i4.p1  ORF type:complete len:183 (-),score=29.13 TRINITY_DN9597_c0_g1_i4:24-572(-)